MSDERKETKKMYVWKSAQLQNKMIARQGEKALRMEMMA